MTSIWLRLGTLVLVGLIAAALAVTPAWGSILHGYRRRVSDRRRRLPFAVLRYVSSRAAHRCHRCPDPQRQTVAHTGAGLYHYDRPRRGPGRGGSRQRLWLWSRRRLQRCVQAGLDQRLRTPRRPRAGRRALSHPGGRLSRPQPHRQRRPLPQPMCSCQSFSATAEQPRNCLTYQNSDDILKQ